MLKYTKTLDQILWLIAGAAAIMLTIFAAVWVANSLSADEINTDSSCRSGKHINHTVDISNDKVSPGRIQASLCDTITITNFDPKGRLMAFGQHEHHQAYDGVSERYLVKNESFTITLVKTGIFRLHDHNDDSVATIFEVR